MQRIVIASVLGIACVLLGGCSKDSIQQKAAPVSKDDFAKLLAGEWRYDHGPAASTEEILRRPDGTFPVFEHHKKWSFTYAPTKEVHGTYTYNTSSAMDGKTTVDKGSGTWTLDSLNPVIERQENGALIAEAELVDPEKLKRLAPTGDAEVDRGQAIFRTAQKRWRFTLKDDVLVIERRGIVDAFPWENEGTLKRK